VGPWGKPKEGRTEIGKKLEREKKGRECPAEQMKKRLLRGGKINDRQSGQRKKPGLTQSRWGGRRKSLNALALKKDGVIDV